MSVDELKSAASASSALPHHLTGTIAEEEASPEGTATCFPESSGTNVGLSCLQNNAAVS